MKKLSKREEELLHSADSIFCWAENNLHNPAKCYIHHSNKTLYNDIKAVSAELVNILEKKKLEKKNG